MRADPVPVLVVQMGHSGRTSGATGAPGEMAFTEAVGAACARLLDGRGGWQVRLIVADPPVAQYRGNAFVAVHADGSNNPAVRGASIGYQTELGRALAHSWADAYVRRGFTGPWHPDNYTANLAQYYGVREAVAQGNRMACIVECGTITNAADRALMLPDRVALAIGAALGIVTEEADMQADEREALFQVRAQFNDTAQSFDHSLGTVFDGMRRILDAVAALESKVDTLVGSGVTLRASGEITVRGETP